MYINGRKLFPIKVGKRKDPVSLTDLVVILISIMYQHPKPPHSDSLPAVVWEETFLNLNLLNFSATPKGLLLLQHTPGSPRNYRQDHVTSLATV
ncbi:protein broad-minded [Salmo trutta]|uniref:protein broad-minded n=1 Tax=Salmo trutta TaxID=8032 RepID=UPI001130B29D|nr:protein broad-minded-like [Salmo trutta]